MHDWAAVRDAEEGAPGILTTSDGSIGQALVKAGDLVTISRTNPAPPLDLQDFYDAGIDYRGIEQQDSKNADHGWTPILRVQPLRSHILLCATGLNHPALLSVQ